VKRRLITGLLITFCVGGPIEGVCIDIIPLSQDKLIGNISPSSFFSADSHFRSKKSGAWHEIETWERSADLDMWIQSDMPPTDEAKSIVIENGHTVEIVTHVHLHKTTIYGLLLLKTNGKMEIPNHDEDGIVIMDKGIFQVITSDNYSDAITLPLSAQSNTSPIHVREGGTIIIDKPLNEAAGSGFEVLATNANNAWEHRSGFVWNNGLPFPTNGITYFPSSPEGVSPVFSVGPRSIPGIASAGTLTINGIFDVRTEVKFSASTGARNFRDGITGNSKLIISEGTNGTQNISGMNSILGGDGLIIVTGKILRFNTSGMIVTVPKDSNIIIQNSGGGIFKSSNVNFIINGTADLTTINMNNGSGVVVINGYLKTAASDGLMGSSKATVTDGIINVNDNSVIEYNSLDSQAITGSTSLGPTPYYHIVFSGSGKKTPKSAIRVHPEGSVTITGDAIVDATSNNIGPENTENQTAFTMDGGRFIMGTLGFNSSGTMPMMKGNYNITGGTIEFASSGSTSQTIRGANYFNIEITGNNIANSSGLIGIKPNGKFIVKSGAVYTSSSGNASIEGVDGTGQLFKIESGGKMKTEVREGFYGPKGGSSGLSPSVRNSIPIIELEEGSTIEYSRKIHKGNPEDTTDGNQKITFHEGIYEYQNLILSGDNDKMAPTGNLIVKGDFSRAENANFIHNNGTVIFKNESRQNIDAKGSIFYNLENQNTARLHIETDLSVKNSLKLTENSKLHLGTGDIAIISDNNFTGCVDFIPDNATISYNEDGGRFVVERYIPKHPKAWQLLSVPTKGATIRQTWQDHQNINSNRGVIITGPEFTPDNPKGFDRHSPAPSMKYLNPLTGLYKGIGSTEDNISDHPAYFLFVRGDRSVDGQINTTPTEVTLYTRGKLYSPSENLPPVINIQADKWNLLGNPYASSIDFEKLQSTSPLKEGYYIWDPNLTESDYSQYGLGGYRLILPIEKGDYEVVPSSGNYADGNPPMIQSGQGFFVYSTSDGIIEFSEDAKSTQSENVFRKGSITSGKFSKIRTNLYTVLNGKPVLLDGTLQLFVRGLSQKSSGYNLPKMMNSGENVALHSDTGLLIVACRALPVEKDTIYYSLTGMNKRNYHLQVSLDEILIEEYEIFIHDSYLDVSHLLKKGESEIQFNVDEKPLSAARDRFYLTFNKIEHPFAFHDEKAEADGESVLLTWKVKNQENVKFYELQYSSNESDFGVLKKVDASSTKNASYQYFHIGPHSVQYFYRIRAILKDGRERFSKTLNLPAHHKNSQVSIFSNPARETIRIKLIHPSKGKYFIRLINSEGKTLKATTLYHTDISNTYKIDVRQLARGIYYLEVRSPKGEQEVIQLLIN